MLVTRTAPLPVLVRIAGTRWAIEELFQTAKGQVGPDHHQVRNEYENRQPAA